MICWCYIFVSKRFMKQKILFLSFSAWTNIYRSSKPCALSGLNPVALSGSTVYQDQCRRITALIRQHTSLSQLDFFVLGLSLFTCWKSFLEVIWLFLRGNRNCLRKITVLLFCIHVALSCLALVGKGNLTCDIQILLEEYSKIGSES